MLPFLGRRFAVLCALGCLCAAQAWAEDTEEKPKVRWSVTPSVSAYFPVSEKAQTRFGETWMGIGIALVPVQEAAPRSGFSMDVAMVSERDDDDFAYLMPLGLRYTQRQPLRAETTAVFGASVDLALTAVRVRAEGIHGKLRTTEGASLFTGLDFGDRVELRARYNLFGDVAGYNFTGTSLSALYHF